MSIAGSSSSSEDELSCGSISSCRAVASILRATSAILAMGGTKLERVRLSVAGSSSSSEEDEFSCGYSAASLRAAALRVAAVLVIMGRGLLVRGACVSLVLLAGRGAACAVDDDAAVAAGLHRTHQLGCCS